MLLEPAEMQDKNGNAFIHFKDGGWQVIHYREATELVLINPLGSRPGGSPPLLSLEAAESMNWCVCEAVETVDLNREASVSYMGNVLVTRQWGQKKARSTLVTVFESQCSVLSFMGQNNASTFQSMLLKRKYSGSVCQSNYQISTHLSSQKWSKQVSRTDQMHQ